MEFELGERVKVPTENQAWIVVAISPGGTWVDVRRTLDNTVRTYRFDSLKKI